MDYSGNISDTNGGWKRYRNQLRLRASDDQTQIKKLEKGMSRGWCIGTDTFKKAMAEDLNQTNSSLRLEPNQLKAFNKQHWEVCLTKALKALNRTQKDVTDATRSARWKLAIASTLKRETSVSNKWLSGRLHMGVARGVSSNCAVYRREHEAHCPHSERLKGFAFAY
jgi:hypothetical protein